PGAQPYPAGPGGLECRGAGQSPARPAQDHDSSLGKAKLRKRDGLTTLYIRLAPRSEGEAASVRFALVADSGALVQQGEGALRAMGDVVKASRRVVLLVAAADVTLLQIRVPPLSAARLKA